MSVTTTAAAFAAAHGLPFADMGLLQQALTQKSLCNETEGECLHNERLEFLGDAIIDFLCAELLFQTYPDAPEGDLTRLRSALVSEAGLTAIGRELAVGAALRMGKGEEKAGGRDRPSIVSAAVEAVCGALYLEAGLEAVRRFIVPHLQARLTQVRAEASDTDARSALQVKMQAERGVTPHYVVIDQSGPAHASTWTVQAWVGEALLGEGVGKSKAAASRAAAAAALRQLGEAGEGGG